MIPNGEQVFQWQRPQETFIMKPAQKIKQITIDPVETIHLDIDAKMTALVMYIPLQY